jgi:hypothetical protein
VRSEFCRHSWQAVKGEILVFAQIFSSTREYGKHGTKRKGGSVLRMRWRRFGPLTAMPIFPETVFSSQHPPDTLYKHILAAGYHHPSLSRSILTYLRPKPCMSISYQMDRDYNEHVLSRPSEQFVNYPYSVSRALCNLSLDTTRHDLDDVTSRNPRYLIHLATVRPMHLCYEGRLPHSSPEEKTVSRTFLKVALLNSLIAR